MWSFFNKPPKYLTKFPYEKIPAFEGTDGFKLVEESTIARYLSGIGTKINSLGSSAQEAVLVDQWVHFAEHEISTPAGYINSMIYGYFDTFDLGVGTCTLDAPITPLNRTPRIIDQNAKRFAYALAYLESHMAARPSGIALGSAKRAQYPHVFAHYNKVTADEKLRQYWGTGNFVDVRVTEPRIFA